MWDLFSIFLFIFSSATKEAIPAEERLSQLLERLESLEYRLNTESRQKTELADEVAQLREENQRLQEESATAAQQLRRFTEWFFQTIEKAKDVFIKKNDWLILTKKKWIGNQKLQEESAMAV